MPETRDAPKRPDAERRICVDVRKISRPIIAIAAIVGSALPGIGTSAPLIAAAPPSAAMVCDVFARSASRQTGVPFDILRAVTRAETGRGVGAMLEPWPWTVNMEGTGKWFADLDSARRYVFDHFKNGARSFDIGCFQINYKWHSHAFRSIDEMFDPQKNALYAALFLKSLFDEFGDWPTAVGAFHSRSPTHSGPYVARFKRIFAALQDVPRTAAPKPGGHAVPLATGPRRALVAFKSGGGIAGLTNTPGSLVPLPVRLPSGARVFIALNVERN